MTFLKDLKLNLTTKTRRKMANNCDIFPAKLNKNGDNVDLSRSICTMYIYDECGYIKYKIGKLLLYHKKHL